jgi:hypothetical protein
MALNGKRTRDARSSGELPSFPTKERIRARAPTLPHRAHLANVLGPDTGEANEPPARMPPPPHPRQDGLLEAGASPGVRLRLREDRRRYVLGHHAAGPTRRVDRAGDDGYLVGVGPRSLRPDRRPRTPRCGGGLLHHQGLLRRREGWQKSGGQGKARYQTLHGGGRKRHSSRHRHRPGKPPRLAAVGRDPRRGGTDVWRVAREYRHPPGSRLRLPGHPPAATRARSKRRDLPEGRGCPTNGNEAPGRGEDKLLAQRSQEARVVHGEARKVVDFWVAFTEVVIIVRRLIREGWIRSTAGKVVLPDGHELSAQALSS